MFQDVILWPYEGDSNGDARDGGDHVNEGQFGVDIDGPAILSLVHQVATTH